MSLQQTRPASPPRPGVAPAVPRRLPRPVLLAGLLVALARLPYVASPVSSDEAGFLEVARGWHAGGGSLYGGYWVDRPPLLIALFRVGGLLGDLLGGPQSGSPGGVVGLRLLGCVAAALTVLGVGAAVHRVAPLGAGWAAAVAAALLATPAVGALDVNGELLAAPLVAWGIVAVLAATTTRDGVRAGRWALLAGGAAIAALLVKQNMADVGVLAAAVLVLSLWAGTLRARRAVGLALGFAAGGVATLGLALAVAAARGSRPSALWFAAYPFRLRATALLTHQPLEMRLERLSRLGELWALSGALLPVLALVGLLVLRRGTAQQRRLGLAVVVLLGYDVVSIAAGGSYWLHYLVQLAVPASIAAGLVAGAGVGARLPGVRAWLRVPAALVVVLCTVTWVGGLGHRAAAPGTVVGRAVAAAAQPDDTVVSLMGNADVVAASGLGSPYRYLWSLPAHTLDPHLDLLAGLLGGPDAPTWVVVRGPATTAYLLHSDAGPALQTGYRTVGRVCGRTVLLRDDVTRGSVHASTGCRLPLSPWLHPDHPDQPDQPDQPGPTR